MKLNGSALQAIYKFDIPSKVPLNGEVSFEELAKECDLQEPDLRRLLRFAITYHRVFQEPKEGYVSHSAASRKLVEDSNAMAGVGAMFDEAIQAFDQVWQADSSLHVDLSTNGPKDCECTRNYEGSGTK